MKKEANECWRTHINLAKVILVRKHKAAEPWSLEKERRRDYRKSEAGRKVLGRSNSPQTVIAVQAHTNSKAA